MQKKIPCVQNLVFRKWFSHNLGTVVLKQYNADGKKKSNALYTVYEFDFIKIYTGFRSETKNISALSKVCMDSRIIQSLKFNNIVH